MRSPSKGGFNGRCRWAEQRETGQGCRVLEVAAILMPQIELDRAVVEILSLERVVRRALVVESGAELPPADRERAFGKQRPEAAAATPERADRFVEHVGHAAGRRSQREGRELRGHLVLKPWTMPTTGLFGSLDAAG